MADRPLGVSGSVIAVDASALRKVAVPSTGPTEGAVFVSNGTGGVDGHLYYRAPSDGALTDLLAGGGGIDTFVAPNEAYVDDTVLVDDPVTRQFSTIVAALASLDGSLPAGSTIVLRLRGYQDHAWDGSGIPLARSVYFYNAESNSEDQTGEAARVRLSGTATWTCSPAFGVVQFSGLTVEAAAGTPVITLDEARQCIFHACQVGRIKFQQAQTSTGGAALIAYETDFEGTLFYDTATSQFDCRFVRCKFHNFISNATAPTGAWNGSHSGHGIVGTVESCVLWFQVSGGHAAFVGNALTADSHVVFDDTTIIFNSATGAETLFQDLFIAEFRDARLVPYASATAQPFSYGVAASGVAQVRMLMVDNSVVAVANLPANTWKRV